MKYKVPFEVEGFTYEESLNRLDDVLRFGICPMLETVEDMLECAGNPDTYFKAIQIAGTNGKTSTSRFVASILKQYDLNVGLYTSPHLVEYPERMEVNGRVVSKEDFAYGLAVADKAGIKVNEMRMSQGLRPYDITEFDLITVASAIVFALLGVDVVVYECGMGGRWDATSAIKSIDTVCVTGVGLDHTRILGDTIEAIAAEKAAIIKSGRKCVLGVGCLAPKSLQDVFLDKCASEGVDSVLVIPNNLDDVVGEICEGDIEYHSELRSTTFEIIRRPERIGGSLIVDVFGLYGNYLGIGALKPSYQAANIAVAVSVVEQFMGHELDLDKVLEGIVLCPTPGRFDVRRADPVVLIDACHNPQSVGVFLNSVDDIDLNIQDRPALLCAVLADKDVEGIVDLLKGKFPEVYVTQTTSKRALEARKLADVFESKGVEVSGVFGSVDEAVSALENKAYIACGSITLAGEVAGILGGTGQKRGVKE